MENKRLNQAIATLQQQYFTLNWHYLDYQTEDACGKIYPWPGPDDEEILVLVHQSSGVQELFHRHDFFYFNFTYRGEYDSLSYKFDNRITIREGELYAGQPFAGHALCVHDNRETVILGVLIRREAFFRSYLPMISSDSRLFHFLTDPVTNRESDEYIHMKMEDGAAARTLLELMAVEYAGRREDTQEVLRALALAFLQQVARQYARLHPLQPAASLSEQIVRYIAAHAGRVSLREVARRFSYNPNYLSTLLRRETGQSFTEILLEQRMQRAGCLLRGTSLSVEEIAAMLGYSNSSNFYKAFRAYYHRSPREYAAGG